MQLIFLSLLPFAVLDNTTVLTWRFGERHVSLYMPSLSR
jgi:hypothetical protein